MPKSEATIQARTDAFVYAKANRPKGAKAYAHVDVDQFMTQLYDHIDHPKHINQGQTQFCGPAAALYALAKDDPMAYAKLALDLLVTGTATVRGWKVDAGALVNQVPPDDKGIGCLDWVTMSCIRKNVGFGALTSVDNTASGTLPFEIVGALKGLGYRDVRNETYSTRFYKADEKNLTAASELFGKGYRVIFCINDSLCKDPGSKSWKPNHFCTLKSEVSISDKKVFCRLWQWGIDHKEPESDLSAIMINLPKDQFMEHYFGYVAGGDYTHK